MPCWFFLFLCEIMLAVFLKYGEMKDAKDKV